MSNLTFLTKEQCFDRNEKLDLFNKRGTKAAVTDFAILLGAYVSSSNYIDSDSSLKGRTGWYWTKTDNGNTDTSAVYENGDCHPHSVTDRDDGGRPALPFSDISQIHTNGVSGVPKKARDGVIELEYGYYPQEAAPRDMQERLERAYKSGSISKTRNSYTTDSRKYNAYNEKFVPKQHEEYEYNGKRYVRVMANSCYRGKTFKLSNGEEYKDGDSVWVEVQPVKWLLDGKAQLMLMEKIIFAGVQFNHERNYRTANFDKTEIKLFMDNHLSKDLEQSIGIKYSSIQPGQEPEPREVSSVRRKSRLERLNPDKTPEDSRAIMTDTGLIWDWIQSGESVLLRGPSGIGKTQRFRSWAEEGKIDLIELKLTNGMFPEKVVGSTNLQTGQDIPPSFAREIVLKGATQEEREAIKEEIDKIYAVADSVYEASKKEDKKIVLLLDELLNVKPQVQSLVYTLVLNRFIESGRGIRLPKNVVIVATGNQKKYSMVAEDLAEPLAKRFYHILDMEPKVGEWITEYAIPHQLHPAVIGYILSKYNSSGKSEELKDIAYFYEEPEVGEENLDKYGCNGKTNDPRKWTFVSDSLTNFDTNLKNGEYIGYNVENLLMRTLQTELREEWAHEFCDFYNLPTLTPEEVVNGKYTEADLPQDINERFSFMTALITADEKQLEACRDFIRKYCGAEYLSVYDIYWAGKDERKMQRIVELQDYSYRGEEARTFGQDGIKVYQEIGTMYSDYLGRDTKEKRDGNGNEGRV